MSNDNHVTFFLNGEEKTFVVDPNEKLLDLLRRQGYTGTKRGCSEATCGSCTVIMDGRAIFACTLFAFQAHGHKIETIEGVGTFAQPHPLQQALVQAGAVQCGFCTPGMVMTAKAMLDNKPNPDEQTMKEYMDGNLCRCTGYEKIEDALHQVIRTNREGDRK